MLLPSEIKRWQAEYNHAIYWEKQSQLRLDKAMQIPEDQRSDYWEDEVSDAKCDVWIYNKEANELKAAALKHGVTLQ